jgi:acyl-CoA thioesterase-1
MTNSTFNSVKAIALIFISTLGCTDHSNNLTKSDSSTSQVTNTKSFKILILGDSLTEGYGVQESEAYPTLLEKRIELEISPLTGISYSVINGGITGSTSSGGVSRIQWLLQSKPDLLLVALGGNDGLRGVPVTETKKNLQTILQKAQEHSIPVVLAGMKIPPNYGPVYSDEFAQIFPTLADSLDIPLIPFLLEGVGGNPKFNLPDRIHPNPAGHKIIGDLVFNHLSEVLLPLTPSP